MSRDRGAFGPLEQLDSVQRQAIDAAFRIATELTGLAGGLGGESMAGGAPVRGRPRLDVGRLRSDVAKASETYSELLRQVLDVAFDAVDELARRPTAQPTGQGPAGSTVIVPAVVRNDTSEPVAGVRPHLPVLVGADGESLAAALGVAPEAVDLQPHEQADVAVSVAGSAGPPPGWYHGLLLAAGLPEAVQAISVEVV